MKVPPTESDKNLYSFSGSIIITSVPIIRLRSTSNFTVKLLPAPDVANTTALAFCSLPKVVITSSYSEAVYTILRKCEEFDETFVQGIYGREHHRTKTEKIRTALGLFSAEVSEALYVGDLASDVLYCRDVPVDIACVGYGYHPSDYLKKFSPEYIIETVEDFAAFLQSLSPAQQP